MNPPPDDAERLFKTWQQRVREAQAVHYECAKLSLRRNLQFGVPVVVLTTLVGTSVFASLAKEPGVMIKVAVGMLSVIAAVLASLQTFLRFSEKAESHRTVAAKYGSLRRELEQAIAAKGYEGENWRAVADALRLKMDQLAAEAPPTSERIFNAVARRFDAELGQATQPGHAGRVSGRREVVPPKGRPIPSSLETGE